MRCMSVCMSVCLCVCLCVCLSVSLRASISVLSDKSAFCLVSSEIECEQVRHT